MAINKAEKSTSHPYSFILFPRKKRSGLTTTTLRTYIKSVF